jgi:putative heme-binding domain-containing protein
MSAITRRRPPHRGHASTSIPKQGDPLMMRSMGGVTQIIPADRVAGRRRMSESLMMSAAQLGLTAQDVADLIAFLRSN